MKSNKKKDTKDDIKDIKTFMSQINEGLKTLSDEELSLVFAGGVNNFYYT